MAEDLDNTVREQLAALSREVGRLRAIDEARRLLGRYMFLCDIPLALDGMSDKRRAAEIGSLFTEDGLWEGVGGPHGQQFGAQRGPDEIAAFMLEFFAGARPHKVFNTHYLCSEQLWSDENGTAEGCWVQFQPWVFEDGHSLLRSSRLHVRFRETPAGWRIAHYRTENLFISELPNEWAQSLLAHSHLNCPVQVGNG